MDSRVAGRLAALCGFAGVAGNIIGVAVLRDVPSAYRPGAMVAWVHETLAAPGAISVSALSFTIGLLALAGWAVMLGARVGTPLARAAGAMIAIGAGLDAAGTLAPLVLARHLGPACRAGADCVPAGLALLGMSLALDALFNLLLGLGLILLATERWHHRGPWRWLAPLMLAAGIASVPVSLQVAYDSAARLLAIAGPLWLATIIATSVLLWRGRS